MTDQREIVTFLRAGGIEWAFMGRHIVGGVRMRAGPSGAAEWIAYLCDAAGSQRSDWHPARDIETAKATLTARVAEWYDAAHTPLAPGQGERLASQARVG